MSREPPLATITVSRTMFESRWRVIASAAVRTMSALASIPSLVAAGRRSDATASIWAATIAGESTSTSVTPNVFCAVTAVTADVPNTPWAAKVLRSA